MTSLVKWGRGPASTYLLTTSGRKSGKPRTTPVNIIDLDGERWLVAPYGNVGWVDNVRATPEVTLRRGRNEESFRAEEVDPEQAGPVLKAYVRRFQVTAPYFDAKRDDPVDRFVAEAARHPVFRLVTVTD
jgi:deazaflavin-dependent oxidoreductase (nitroreductase family)